jgi:ABC-2 type transport system ATP-binding protein
MDAVIRTHGLTKYFGSKKVVDKLDLEIPAGAIWALLGDNGAGKSTTIRMLTGQLLPDSGQATILGRDCWKDAVEMRHQIGYVPEKPRFYDWMTTAEIGRFAAGFHRAGYAGRYDGLLDRFGLERGVRLSNLSKGGYARVGLALALASDPQVLILDEPTSGLDLFTRREFLGSMIDLAAEGRTILISSHGIAEIERVASHVAFLAQGQLLLSGTLDDLRGRMVCVRLRHDGAPPAPEGLGAVLDVQSDGKEWQAIVLDPDRVALADLRHRPGVLEVTESLLDLEEMYTALLARFHRGAKASPTPLSAREPALTADEGGRS